jgi:hypothetical protein
MPLCLSTANRQPPAATEPWPWGFAGTSPTQLSPMAMRHRRPAFSSAQPVGRAVGFRLASTRWQGYNSHEPVWLTGGKAFIGVRSAQERSGVIEQQKLASLSADSARPATRRVPRAGTRSKSMRAGCRHRPRQTRNPHDTTRPPRLKGSAARSGPPADRVRGSSPPSRGFHPRNNMPHDSSQT